jgi:hypothetical protein
MPLSLPMPLPLSIAAPAPAPVPHPESPSPRVPTPTFCHASGKRWKALSKAEKAKYKGSLRPLPSSPPGENHFRPPASAPCLSPAPTTTAGAVPDQVPSATRRVHLPAVAVPAPASMPAGFVWVSRVADQRKTLSREALARQSSSDSQTSCCSGSSCSFDDARPAPGSTLTSAAPRAAPRAASRAPPPYAPPAAPPPLPAGLAHSLDELIGLDDALAAPPAPSAAEPNVSSSSWLKQQELAEVLEDHLTGVEAVEVSKTHRV